jgi:dihydropteroate synthase
MWLGSRELDLANPAVMGILNVTPDSFSDGGRFLNFDSALLHAEEMSTAGAAIIDVGGESTRPGSAEVPVQEELDRVIPIIEAVSSRFDVAVSIASRNNNAAEILAHTPATSQANHKEPRPSCASTESVFAEFNSSAIEDLSCRDVAVAGRRRRSYSKDSSEVFILRWD